MRNVSLSKYISKSVHFLTAFVYLFTFLGPSLAIATNTITVVKVIEQERVQTLPTLRLNPREEYQRFDLKITPENSNFRQGVHFRFQDYSSPELSLETFVNFNGPFPFSNFSPLIQKDLQTGFTVSLPNVGEIQCDWQGNLKLVGLHTTHPQTPALALNLVTEGTVEFSDVTLENLSLKAKKATFLKDVTIQEDSVFDIKVLDLASSGFENTKRMTFLSKTRFLSKQIWRNKGGIVGEKSLFFNNTFFSNLSSVHSKRYLRLISDYFANYHGTFHGDLGTTVRAKSGFYNNYGGKITSGGLTRIAFFMANGNDLGDIRGQNVILEDTSGAEHFTLKNGKVTAQESVSLVGQSPQMATVQFDADQLILDADSFELGVQKDVKRTLVKRSKDQSFTLTKPYESDGSLEFWQRDLETRNATKEAMLERFGDEKGDIPAPDSTIDLQALVKTHGGLKFFTPHAKVRLGDATKEELLSFIADQGWLEAYATLFDLEKGTLAAENGFIHAPGGILTGRLIRDETRNCFVTVGSHKHKNSNMAIGSFLRSPKLLYQGEIVTNIYNGHHLLTLPVSCQNGSFLSFKETLYLKGPLSHFSAMEAKNLILDTPSDSYCTASNIKVFENLHVLGDGDLYLTRTKSKYTHVHGIYGLQSALDFINSDPAKLEIYGTISGKAEVTIYNESSVFHAHSRDDSIRIPLDINLTTGYYQKFISVNEFEASELQNSYYTPPSSYRKCFSHRPSDLSNITFPYFITSPEYSGASLLYSWGFLQKTNDFAGAEQLFPAQTSFGDDTIVTPDENRLTTLGGDFQAPLTLVMVDQGGAEIGSVPTLTVQKTYTHSQRQSLLPETFNLNVTVMSENLRRLMAQKPQEEAFFRFQPRFWFEAEKAQQFHKQVRPYVRVQNPRGGYDELEGQALFTLSPDMLISRVQDKALEVLGRGTIEDYRKIDEDQVLELHHNFVEYIKDVGLEDADLTQALMDPNSCLPMPKKPFICYESLVNEEGIAELSPIIWLPQEMHKKSGIQTRLLLSIPMGMSFNDLMAHARKNGMLQPALEKLVGQHSHMIPKIDQMALKYREDNGFAEDDVLPPMGEITLNGKIRADDVFILNTGNVINHADVKCQDAYLASFFGSVIMSSVVERESRGNGNFQDKILAQARLEASNLIKIFAGKDVIFQGAETVSEVATHILALARIFDIPAVLVSQRTEQLSGKYEGTETWMHIHNHVSKHASNGSLKQEALDSQELCGPQYTADFIDILSEGDIEITDAIDHFSHSFSGKSSGGFKTKKRQESEQRQTSRGAGFHAKKAPTNLESRKGNLGLTAPQFTGGYGATLSAPLGEIMIRLGRESFEKSSSSTMTSSTWNKMVQKSEKHLTFSVPSSDGPVTIKALKAIVETIQGKELELLKHLEIIDGELITRALAELHEYDETVVESLGGPAAAVIAIAVSCLTAGAAGPVLIGALGQVLGSAFAAGFASLASQAAVSLISNQGDLSKVVKEITSSQALRSLATSMVTAGLVAGATELVNGVTSAGEGTASATTQGMAQSTAQSATQSTASLGNAVKATSKAFDIGERIQAGLIRASSETLVNSTIGGQDFEEAIIAAARSGIANIAGGFFAHEWGLEYKDVDSQIDYFTHKLIHGIIGAGMGAISDGEALAGFIGGVVGEVVGEAYADTHPEGFNPDAEDYDPDLRDSLKNRGKILTQVSAALAAAFLGENPNVAACTAFNAVHENAFEFPDVIEHRNDEINTCEMELNNLEDALDQATSSQERQALALKISQKEQQLFEARSYLGHFTENQQQFWTARDEAWETFMATGDVENETIRGLMDPVNRFFDGIQESSARITSTFIPEIGLNPTGWEALEYGHRAHLYQDMRVGQAFVGVATDLLRIPKNYYELGIMAAPLGTVFKPISTSLKALGRGTANSLRNVPVFSRSVPQTPYMLTTDMIIPEGYHLRYLSNQTAPLVIRNPGQAFYLDQMTLQGGKPVPIFDLQKATSKIHGCSNAYVGETHVYVIRDSLGRAYKIGESMQGYTALGLSKRAEQQAAQLYLENGERFTTEVLHKFPTKQLAKTKETKIITTFRKVFGEDTLSGNLGNH